MLDLAKRTPQEILALGYHRDVYPEPDGSGWNGRILEFPGCFACGDTEQGTREYLERMAEAWLLACLDRCLPIPEPLP